MFYERRNSIKYLVLDDFSSIYIDQLIKFLCTNEIKNIKYLIIRSEPPIIRTYLRNFSLDITFGEICTDYVIMPLYILKYYQYYYRKYSAYVRIVHPLDDEETEDESDTEDEDEDEDESEDESDEEVVEE